MRPRPLVHVAVSTPPSQVLTRFRDALEADAAPCEGHVGRRDVSLRLRAADRHAWSPWLSLEVHPDERGARLRGRFGPEPRLWTLFVAIYSALVAAFIGGVMYGYVQWRLDLGTSGLQVAAVALVALGLACAVDLAGRRLGSRQMDGVRRFVEDVLGDARDLE